MHTRVLQVSLSSKGIRPVRNGHPWVYNNAIAGRPEDSAYGERFASSFGGTGSLVWEHTRPILVCDPSGAPLGWGTYNRNSRLAIRMLTRDVEHPWTAATLADVLRAALARRRILWEDSETTAFRLVFGEADGIPGLVVDRYAGVLAVEYSSAFAWDNRRTIEETLRAFRPDAPDGGGPAGEVGSGAPRPDTVRIVRGWDEQLAKREGIPASVVDSSEEAVPVPAGEGTTDAARGQDSIVVRENGLPWRVQPGAGQKTGLFCDQRENRRAVAALCHGRRVLDAFSYHGGFGLTARTAGATEVCCVDSSREALDMVAANAREQGIAVERDDKPVEAAMSEPDAGSDRRAAHHPDHTGVLRVVQGDFFAMARQRNGENGGVPSGLEHWDVIILDPPKLVPGRRHLDAGLRAYKDLNLSVMRGMAPGALLVTFSCSGAVSRDDFRRVLAWAATDAGRSVRILETLGQSADHPVPLAFPEAEYLKGFVLMVE